MRLWSKLAGLRLTLETAELLPHVLHTDRFERHTTVLRFTGAGLDGFGEDVVYEREEHLRLRQAHVEWPRGEFDLYFGGAQGVVVDPRTKLRTGGADPRRDGYALAY